MSQFSLTLCRRAVFVAVACLCALAQNPQPRAPLPQQAQNRRSPGTPTAALQNSQQRPAPGTPGASVQNKEEPQQPSADQVFPIQFPLEEEIIFTAVGDVMLGTTFPDSSGGDLPPNDGADILQEVAPILKLGDITFGNLEGPLVDGGISSKCHGKKLGTCYAFRVP